MIGSGPVAEISRLTTSWDWTFAYCSAEASVATSSKRLTRNSSPHWVSPYRRKSSRMDKIRRVSREYWPCPTICTSSKHLRSISPRSSPSIRVLRCRGVCARTRAFACATRSSTTFTTSSPHNTPTTTSRSRSAREIVIGRLSRHLAIASKHKGRSKGVSVAKEVSMARLCILKRLVAFTSGLCALFALPPVLAVAPDESGVSAVVSQRPRIGLVLAGGGAKGGAHIGVLKVLEEQRVPIDCIAGTSMGALIGAGYASGLPAADLEAFVTGIDWQSVVGGVGRRSQQPIEEKRLETAASAHFALGVVQGQIVTPGGLTDTSAIDDLLRGYVARARMVPDFDQLPIPFRAVATDMVSGQMVVLKSGDLATAMRASMAIPGAFAPVPSNGYILADGGMVRNIPIDVARETCADVVIV